MAAGGLASSWGVEPALWTRAVDAGRWREAVTRGWGGRDIPCTLGAGALPALQAWCRCGSHLPPRSSPGSLSPAVPGPGSWTGSRAPAPSVAGTSEQSVSKWLWAFHVVSSLRTAGWNLVFHQNSQGFVSCPRDNWWFSFKG